MRIKKLLAILITASVIAATVVAQQQFSQLAPDPAKLMQHVSYLASDALNGRRTGTPGANDAAHYIAGEFSRIGLRPATQKGGASRRLSIAMSQYLQTFPYVAGVELGAGNVLTFANQPLRVGEDWMPLGFSANGNLETTPVMFVGYGITASSLNHDDYSGQKAAGKIALALAGTPDGDNPHGDFAQFEGVRWKAIAARNAGAKALIIVASESNLKDDRMAELSYDNGAGDAGLPVVVVSQRVVGGGEGIVRLQAWAKQAGNGSENELASMTIDLVRREVPAYNVIGILDGSDPTLKNETIILGAHYDHLGRGGEGSLAPHQGEIHHGADDNASGVAGVIELARLLAAQRPRPRRTVVFIAFSGEEEGLLGSNYYVNHPLTPLTNTVAMMNMDMIGRMRDRKLIVGGVGTAKEWREMIASENFFQTTHVTATTDGQLGTSGGLPMVVSANGRPIVTTNSSKAFNLTLQDDGYGPSDHASFYSKQIPVLFFWTGNHPDYHKPSDAFDKLNYADEARILGMVARMVRDLDRSEKRLTYTVAKSDSAQTTGFRVYLGTIPNYADTSAGLLLDGVREDSPAAKAELKAGDRIVKISGRDIHNVYDYTYALGEMKAGQEYEVEVVRGTERLSLKIIPAARK
ncbi:MAG: M20/M25/M40 family metallo-hydrolase [Pyrinomonadaceae bacterium]